MNEKNTLEVLGEIFASCQDLSSQSDELAAASEIWTIRRRLARGRVDPLFMFPLRPGERALVVDPGDGAWTRFLLERNLQVTAWVPNPLAEATLKQRIRQWCGETLVTTSMVAVKALGTFDWILAPVETATRWMEHVEASGIESFLDRGNFVGAFDNPLSVGRQLGITSATDRGSRSRDRGLQGLRNRLQNVGFPQQNWFYAYPASSQPSVILDDSFWAMAPSADWVDQMVREPLDLSGPKLSEIRDSRALHRYWVEEGLGPHVAGSFVVAAARNPTPTNPRVASAKAWLFGGDRLHQWRRKRVLKIGPQEQFCLEDLTSEVQPSAGWIRQNRRTSVSWVKGRTLEQEALEACRRVDREALQNVLDRWVKTVTSSLESDSPEWWDQAMPLHLLDVELSNFVTDSQGEIHGIDEEWVLEEPISVCLALTRALTSLAGLAVRSGLWALWGRRKTVQEITVILAKSIGLDLENRDFVAARSFESRLMQTVQGGKAADHLAMLEASARACAFREPLESTPAGETGDLRREIQKLQLEMEDLYADRDRLQEDVGILKTELDRVSSLYWEARAIRDQLSKELEDRPPFAPTPRPFWRRFLKE